MPLKNTATCQHCGIMFPVRWPRNPNKYCSRECKSASPRPSSRKAPLICTCKQCGQSFESRHRNNPNTYCSLTCRNEAYQKPKQLAFMFGTKLSGVPYTCEQCGASGFTHPCMKTRRFCSDECRLLWFSQHFRGERSPQWLGGQPNYYGPNWRQQRDAARERDQHTCQHCGVTSDQLPRAIAVHHIVPFRSFPREQYEEANRLSNLICLCGSCHQRTERRYQVQSAGASCGSNASGYFS